MQLDRNGYARDSSGGYAKAGTSFEFTRLLTGEISLGYAARDYVDPQAQPAAGPAGLVLAGLDRDAADHGEILFQHPIDETTLPGASGVLTHTYTVEVDHDFRRWLTAIGKFT